LDDQASIELLDLLLRRTRLWGAPEETPLWRSGTPRFSALFRWAVERLQLKAGRQDGFTPASLRTGRVTALYERGVSLEELSWNLRHRDRQTLCHYLQDAVASATVHPPETLERLASLRAALPAIMARLRQDPGTVFGAPAVLKFPRGRQEIEDSASSDSG
jgi:hypothetical protein